MKKREDIPPVVADYLDAVGDSVPDPNQRARVNAQSAMLAKARRMRAKPSLSQSIFGFNVMRNRKDRFIMSNFVRAMLSLFVAFGVTTGTTLAADASNPGQLLYGLDGALEKVQTKLAFSDQLQTQLQYKLAEERAEELLFLYENGENLDASYERLQNQFQNAFQNASELDDAAMQQMMEKLQTMAQEHAESMEQAGCEECAQLMHQAKSAAQGGMDNPAEFQNQMNSGKAWDDGEQGSGGNADDPSQQQDQTGQGGNQQEEPGNNGEQTQTQNCEEEDTDCEPDGDQNQMQNQHQGENQQDNQP